MPILRMHWAPFALERSDYGTECGRSVPINQVAIMNPEAVTCGNCRRGRDHREALFLAGR